MPLGGAAAPAPAGGRNPLIHRRDPTSSRHQAPAPSGRHRGVQLTPARDPALGRWAPGRRRTAPLLHLLGLAGGEPAGGGPALGVRAGGSAGGDASRERAGAGSYRLESRSAAPAGLGGGN